MGTVAESRNPRAAEALFAEGGGFDEGKEFIPLADDGTVPDIDPAKVGCMRFFGLRLATRV